MSFPLRRLKKKLKFKHFLISQILILICGLIFIAVLYYILNIQYQKSSDPFANGPLTTAPKTLTLDLDHPDDNTLTLQKSILISGKTTPLSNVLIYTDTQNMVIESKPDGTFSTVLDMVDGANKIWVVVFDQTGDSKSTQRNIYYSKEEI